MGLQRLIVKVMHAAVSASESWILRSPIRHDHDGLQILMHRSKSEHVDTCVGKVRSAIDLIAQYDQTSLSQMRSHFSLVLIWPGVAPALGLYHSIKRRCELDCGFLSKSTTSPEHVALILIHELRHARLRALRKQPVMSVAHEEWLCVGAEISFAQRLPNAGHLIQEAKTRMTRRPDFYSPQAKDDRTLQQLRNLGTPRLFVRILERMYQRKYGARSPIR
jgi:hypothetical protein